ncbi:unnamed protein product [Camellia sinensis]
MYDNLGAQPGVQRPPPNPQPNPFGDAFVGAGSGLIRGGLGAYGERILGSSSEYVQSNISRYFSDPQYYFQVNDQYVRNKLKVVLFPFLHRGHWTRITEPVGGRLSYKPPIYDINAPDLYIPLMAFGTYVVLAGFSLGLQGKFSPEALNWLFIKGLVGWFLQVSLLKMSLFSLGSGEAPLLDIVAYAGYSFTGMCLAVLGRIVWSYSYYFLMPWTCLCMGIYLVKTMKRVLFAEYTKAGVVNTQINLLENGEAHFNQCNIQSVLESYISPVEIRPGELVVPLCNTIPVIDLENLGQNQTELVQQIVKASQEFGFFQSINHGVPEGLVQDVMRVAKELFELPADDNASLYSEDPKKSCRLYMSIDCVHEKVLFWRDTLRFHCHPLDDYVEDWPRNPARYRLYDNLGTQSGLQRPPPNPQPNPFGNAFVGAGLGLIRGGLGAYGERILGSRSEYVQSNASDILWLWNSKLPLCVPEWTCLCMGIYLVKTMKRVLLVEFPLFNWVGN